MDNYSVRIVDLQGMKEGKNFLDITDNIVVTDISKQKARKNAILKLESTGLKCGRDFAVGIVTKRP